MIEEPEILNVSSLDLALVSDMEEDLLKFIDNTLLKNMNAMIHDSTVLKRSINGDTCAIDAGCVSHDKCLVDLTVEDDVCNVGYNFVGIVGFVNSDFHRVRASKIGYCSLSIKMAIGFDKDGLFSSERK